MNGSIGFALKHNTKFAKINSVSNVSLEIQYLSVVTHLYRHNLNGGVGVTSCIYIYLWLEESYCY